MLRKTPVPVILQTEAPECGIACVAMIASFHGLRTDLAGMRRRLATSLKGVTLKHISQMAETLHMNARGVQVPLEALHKLTLPAVLHWDMNHFVVLTRVDGKRITIHDPARGKRALALTAASRHFTGVALEITPLPGFRKVDERERLGALQLLGAAAGQRAAIGQILLLSLALEVFAIAMPLFLQLVIDQVVVGRDRDFLTVLGCGFAALVVIQAAVMALRSWAGVVLSTRLNLQLQTALFDQLIRLPLAWFEKRHIGDILSRFRSIDAIQRTLTTTFVETIVDGLMVAVTLLVMSVYSGTLTLVVLCAALLYGAARVWAYGALRQHSDEQMNCEARAGTFFIETLRGMLAVKLNLREDERRAGYQNLAVEQVNAGVRVQQVQIAQRAVHGLIFGLENVTIVWLGALAVIDGRLSVGMLYAFLGFKLVFLSRINTLVDKLIDFRMLSLHAERIADIALAQAEPAPAPRAPLAGPLCIEAHGLAYAYGIEGPIFRDIDLSIRSGETVALVGPSGCGKTTLLKVLAGLLPASAGALRFNGRLLAETDLRELRTRLALVLHDDQLFAGNLYDNITFFDPAADAARVRDCARLAMIDQDIERMPMQYHTLVGNLGVALSGGQKQRLLLARALYRGPQILMLDEAFDQLDLERAGQITAGLRKTGLGLLIVSHRPDTVRAADRVVTMRPAAV